MRTFVLLAMLSSFFSMLMASPSLPPHQSSSLYDHLFEVNPRWALEEAPDIDWCQEIEFESDKERIRMHLWMVERLLQQSLSTSPARKQLIQTLASYREQKVYPQNHYHSYRRPYFIDNHGTACAVGHLLQQSGYADVAKKISSEMNFAYLLDMPYKEIGQWADQHSFTLDELALIQPAYPPTTAWASLGTGANDVVTALYVDDANDRMIVAGKFSEMDQVSCQQIAVYQNEMFSPLGDGVSGDITSIISMGTDIYLGGEFDNDKNIAIWDGNTWTYEEILPGTVQVLYVWKDELYAGGTFSATGFAPSRDFLVVRRNGSWESTDWNGGAVYSLTSHDGKLIAGGSALEGVADPYYVSVLDDINGWEALTDTNNRLDNTVYALLSEGGQLYAAGGCIAPNDSPTFCMARLENGQWNSLIQHDAFSFPNEAIHHLHMHYNELFVAGNIKINQGFGTLGSGVARVLLSQPYVSVEAIADLDTTVHALATFKGQMVVGGAFTTNGSWNPAPVPYLIQTDNFTGLPDPWEVQLSLWPNPVADQAQGKVDINKQISALHLYDLTGKRVRLQYEVLGNEFSFQRNDLPAGMYLLQIQSEGEIVSQGKIMLR